MLKANNLRRLYEAARKDDRPTPSNPAGGQKFFDDLAEAFRSKQIRGEDFRIRQLFENFIPHGREIVDSWNPEYGGSGAISLTEAGDAVMSTAFSNITGQIVYSATMEAFQSEQYVFTPTIRTIPTQFNGEKIAGITRIGDLAEVVGEAMPYPNVGVTEDYIETPVTTKRGFIVPLTREAVFFDRTSLVTQRCSEVGEFLGLNKEKRVIDCIIDENVTSHRYKWRGTVYATYQTSTPWDNVTASAALANWTDLDEAEQTLAAIVDPNTGEPIQNTPSDLIVTRQNLNLAKQIVYSSMAGFGDGASASVIMHGPASNVVNSGYRILSSQLLAARMGTDTTYYVGTLSKAFAYMQNWPLTTVQAPPSSEDEFNRDIVMKWKASERGACATLEPRVMNKSTVA